MNKTDNGRNIAVQEASEWLLRLQDDGISDADLEAWGNWMAQSPENARAFDDISALWEASASLTSESLDVAIRNKVQPGHMSARRPHRGARWLAVAAMAAACGVVAVGVLKLRPEALPPTQLLVTQKGQRLHAMLADGSAVDLDADSRLTVTLGGASRELVLEQGRAHFTVAHDAAHAFRVQAGGIVSQAIGTRFSVGYREANRIAVVVDEGRVRVSQRQADKAVGTATREAGRNERIRYSVDGGLEGPQPLNADLAMSWREGSVIYQSETLASVIEDLNRYSSIPLRLEDASLGRVLVTGRWESANVDTWVDGLARALRLQVIRQPGEILLASREQPPPPARPSDPATGSTPSKAR